MIFCQKDTELILCLLDVFLKIVSIILKTLIHVTTLWSEAAVVLLRRVLLGLNNETYNGIFWEYFTVQFRRQDFLNL